MAEGDGRAEVGPALVDEPEVLGLDDALVGDALQGHVLAFGGTLHRAALVLGGLLAVVVQAYPADASEPSVLGLVVGPGGAAVEGAFLQGVLPQGQRPVHGHDADGLHQAADVPEEARVDPAVRGAEQPVPHPGQAGLFLQSVAAVDVGLLDLVEPAPQVGVGEEDAGLDEGHPDFFVQSEFLHGPLQTVLELLGLEVGQVQRAADGPALSVPVGEGPVRSAVGGLPRVALDLHQVGAGGGDGEQVALADALVAGGEGEPGPGAIVAGRREPLPDVFEGGLLPGEFRGFAPPPVRHPIRSLSSSAPPDRPSSIGLPSDGKGRPLGSLRLVPFTARISRTTLVITRRRRHVCLFGNTKDLPRL